MRQRYCIISGIYPPDIGGPAKFSTTFANFLLSKKSSVRIISYTDSSTTKILNGNLKTILVSRRLPKIPRYLNLCLAILKSVINREHIIANGCFVEIALLRLFLPFKYVTKIPGDIVWERARNSGLTTLTIEEFQNTKLDIKYQIFRKLFVFSLKQSRMVIVPSSHLQSLAIDWGIPPHKISVIHNSINLDLFRPSDANKTEYDVLSVSRLVAWKGLEDVIRVCSDLKLTLAIIGDGPLKSQLQTLSEEVNCLATFFGDVNQETLVELYQKGKYFVLNSSFEATSYALLEAMACGLVPISKDSTGSNEIIQHKVSGMLCGPTTNFNLDTALQYLMSNPVESSRMSMNARSRVDQYFNIKNNFRLIKESLDE